MNEGLKQSLKQAVRAIQKAKKILVVSHMNPDGDTIGCQLALGLALMLLGKKVILLNQDGVPSRFQFLPGSELIVSESTEKADVSIAVDCGSVMQLGNSKSAFFRSKVTIQIDHHDYGKSFGKIQVVEEDASAVGEIVYELIRALKIEVTQSIATCLMASIIVDTGSFRFSNIRAKTFKICSELIKTGVDLPHLVEESYWQKSRSMARLSGYCMMKTEFSKDGLVAWSSATQKDLKRFGAHLSDADSVADDLRSIEGVKATALFRETPTKKIRVSLRSSYGINVAQVAKLFGGGGHHNSAGCVIKNSEREKQRLLKELEALVS